MPQRPYDRGCTLTLTRGGAMTPDVASRAQACRFVEHERANTSRVANTPYTRGFVAWFTFASMVIGLFFAAGERLKLGRGLLRQPSCNAQGLGKVLGVEPVELPHGLI